MENNRTISASNVDWVKCSFVERDILLMRYEKDLVVDKLKAKQLVAYRLDFASHKDHYLLIDMSNVKHVDAEAKNFLQSEENGLKNIKGAAFVADSPVTLLLANIFNKTHTKFESMIFTTVDEALDWLKKYRDGKL